MGIMMMAAIVFRCMSVSPASICYEHGSIALWERERNLKCDRAARRAQFKWAVAQRRSRRKRCRLVEGVVQQGRSGRFMASPYVRYLRNAKTISVMPSAEMMKEM